MKVAKNPFRPSSFLIELSTPEYEYLKAYIRDMASREGEVTFGLSAYRQEKFDRFYREFLKCDKSPSFFPNLNF